MAFKLLIFFSHSLAEFRLPELDAVAKIFNINVDYDREADLSSPFMLCSVANEEQARLLGSRCILIKHIIHYWADGPNYDEMHASLLVQPQLWEQWKAGSTFRVTAAASNHKIMLPRHRQIAEGLAFMDLRGKVDLAKPDLEMAVYEHHVRAKQTHVALEPHISLHHVWIGRKICDGRRDLLDVFHLKKRAYVGNTSMEAEVSLVMANMALAAPGALVYDPFAGTGSMLLTAAHFGALVVGSDLDGRHMRGHRKERAAAKASAETSLFDGARQYNVMSKLCGCLVFDLTQHPWRRGGIFDAILCDPPYGVRAGAKRIGRLKGLRKEPIRFDNGSFYHHQTNYLPPLVPWPMEDVLDTLLLTARDLLKIGGRLVYFLPTVTEEYVDDDVPRLPGLRLIANSPQVFNKWTRRLITMERVPDEELRPTDPAQSATKREPAHAHFNHKFYAAFDANTYAEKIPARKLNPETLSVEALTVAGG